jgi:hypothetical protein
MSLKTAQLQIRVTPEQKRRLKKLARDASMDMSEWVLSRVLPDEADRFQELASRLNQAEDGRYAFAEMADFLRPLKGGAFARAVAHAPTVSLDPDTANHLAGAIELAAGRRGQKPPDWLATIPSAGVPRFGSQLENVRLHLLTQSPVALRRRNLFMDASIDERV